jgi:hypothetical protein
MPTETDIKISRTITQKVRVNNRTLTALFSFNHPGRRSFLHLDCDVLHNMPKGEDEEEVEIHFFLFNGSKGFDTSFSEVEKEYEARGLKPADPYSLLAFNLRYPSFADERHNLTYWRNVKKGEREGGIMAFENNIMVEDTLRIQPDFFIVAHHEWWYAGIKK